MEPRPVYRTSAVFPIFRENAIETSIEFLNYWPLKGIREIGAICTLRDQAGQLVHRENLKLDEIKAYSLNCSEMLETAGISGDFKGSLEFEAFSGQNLGVPTPALIANYQGPATQTMVHAYTRTYNDYEEAQRLSELFPGEEYGWPLFNDEENETFFVLQNGPVAVEPQTLTVDLYNSSGQHIRRSIEAGSMEPYACRWYPAAGDENIRKFLNGKTGWMQVQYLLRGIVPIIMGGTRRRADGAISAAHGAGPNNTRGFYLTEDEINPDQSPYHLPVSIVAPHLAPKIYFYPPFGETTIGLDAHLYDASGKQIYAEVDCYEIAGGGSEMCTIDCAPWIDRFPETSLIDFVANPRDITRIPSRWHVSIQYGNSPLDMSMAEIFKPYLPHEHAADKLRWGMVDLSSNRKTYVGIRSVGFGPEDSWDAKLELRLYRAADSKFLQRTLTIPANGSAEPSVDKLFPEAEEFLGGKPGWYATQCERSVRTIFVVEDLASGHTGGEHGF